MSILDGVSLDMIVDDILRLVTACMVLWAVIKGHQNGKAIQGTEKAVNEVHLSLNSRLSELIAAAKSVGHVEGAREERDRGGVNERMDARTTQGP